MGQEMVESKLKLWEKGIKWVFMKLPRPSMQTYFKLSQGLKNDSDIKMKMVAVNKGMLLQPNFGGNDLKKAMIIVGNEIFKDAPWSKKQEVLDSIPEKQEVLDSSPEKQKLINMLNQQEKLIYIEKHPESIKHLDEKMQRSLLTESQEYFSDPEPGQLLSGEKKRTSPLTFAREHLKYFSPNVVKEIIQTHLNMERESKGTKISKFLSEMKIAELSKKTQLEIAQLDTRFVKLMSTKAQIEYFGNNPMLIKYLSLEAKKQLIKEQPEYLRFIGISEYVEIIDSTEGLLEQLSEEDRIKYNRVTKVHTKGEQEVDTGKRKISKKAIKARVIENMRWMISMSDLQGDTHATLELLSLDTNLIYAYNGDIETLLTVVKEQAGKSGVPEIEGALNEITRIRETEKRKSDEMTAEAIKLLTNQDIVQRVDPNLIGLYIRNPQDRTLLLEIIEKAYGTESRQILEENPDIANNQINRLEIFNPILIEKFGKGTISNMLAYRNKSHLILIDLAKDPNEMKKFEEFMQIFGEEPDSALGFNNKLLAYYHFKELFANIDFEYLTQQQKDTIVLMYDDYFMSKNANEPQIIQVTNLEEIDSYEARRKQIYDDLAAKVTGANELKEAISRRFFGMRYEKKPTCASDRKDLPLESMVDYYSLESFLTDERTINCGMFSNQELDMMEVARIIRTIEDLNVLSKIYQALSERTDVLRPIDFTRAKAKIPLQYSKELVNSLLTVEQAKDKAKRGETGIEIQEEEGFTTIKLKGIDFATMVLDERTGKNSDIINGNVYTNDFVGKYPHYGEDYAFVMEGIGAEQIVMMSDSKSLSTSGINIEDTGKVLNGETLMDYPEKLYQKALKDTYGNAGPSVKINKRDTTRSSPTFGEKIKSKIRMMVYGEINEEHIKIAREKTGEEKPIIYQIVPEYYYEHRFGKIKPKEQRPKSKLVENIEKVARGDADDQR